MARCRPAPACSAALHEATTKWPRRRTSSDGICGDPAHQGTVSDHNPDASGFAHAWDLSHDPANGVDCNVLAEQIKARKDYRVKYIIWNRKIWNPAVNPNWRPYSGANPHTSHMHVSIISSYTTRNDTSSWFEAASPPVQEEEYMPFTVPRIQGGYIVVGVDGGVFTYDGAPYLGSLPGINVVATAVGAVWTLTGNGYWIMDKTGAIFSFGDAQYKGGFNAYPESVKGGRIPVGLVTKGNGYCIITLDPSGDGSLYDGYCFGI